MFKHQGTNPPYNSTAAFKGYWPKTHLGYKEAQRIEVRKTKTTGNVESINFNTATRQHVSIDLDALTAAPSVANAEIKIDLSFGGAATYKLGGTQTPDHHSGPFTGYNDELQLLRFDGDQQNPNFIQYHQNTNHPATQPEGLTGSCFYIRLRYKQLIAGSTNNFEFKSPNIKKSRDKNNDQYRIS